MSSYARPPLPDLVFHDEHGEVIPYGNRWAAQDWDGPEDTYSVTRHPERFAPLLEVARALIAHLVQTYDVHRSDTVPTSTHQDVDPRLVVELTPRSPDAAPITFTLTAFPGVRLGAGSEASWSFPSCGCDHCDDDVEDAADELERTVFAVVAGRLTEWTDGYSLDDVDGETWQSAAHAPFIEREPRSPWSAWEQVAPGRR